MKVVILSNAITKIARVMATIKKSFIKNVLVKLKILTWKTHPQIKLQRLQKLGIWAFD